MSKSTIYILDDDDEVRSSLVALLESEGFAAVSFAKTDDFLTSCGVSAPDCAVIDLRMPGVSGLELLAIMRQRQMATPVVVITGHGDVSTAVQSMKLGAIDVLQKPFAAEALLTAIATATAASPRAAGPALALAPTQNTAPVRALTDPNTEVKRRLDQLSPREREILNLILRGLSSRDIAAELGISVQTVNNHRTMIKTKMNANTVAHLIAMLTNGASVA